MEAVKFAALDAIPDNFQLLLGAVKVTVNFVIQRPKNHYGTGKNSNILKHSAPKMFHTQKPDAAKLYRSTEDALTGILWKDDCQVAVVGLAKYWTDSVKGTEHQGCKIAVEPLQKKEN
jgi:Holliday junction resolvase RusA-like endonuclease